MSLRAQALAEFDLPAAPQQLDELLPSLPGVDLCRVHAPSGRFLLLCSSSPLQLAFETTLFDLLCEAHYPSPRPLRARGGSFVVALRSGDGVSAAACFAWPAGEAVTAETATVPQLLEIGRLLARLHQLGETHPASVADPGDGVTLLSRARDARDRAPLMAALGEELPSLPSGAVHGGLGPACALFLGERCSGVLPAGRSCAGGLLLDLCEAAIQWTARAPSPLANLRALFSGYQALRRFHREELAAAPRMLRHAAAREGARRAAMGLGGPLEPLRQLATLHEHELREATGA